jgi:hypothetical protein
VALTRLNNNKSAKLDFLLIPNFIYLIINPTIIVPPFS